MQFFHLSNAALMRTTDVRATPCTRQQEEEVRRRTRPNHEKKKKNRKKKEIEEQCSASSCRLAEGQLSQLVPVIRPLTLCGARYWAPGHFPAFHLLSRALRCFDCTPRELPSDAMYIASHTLPIYTVEHNT